jgi:YVTN family beta-propeller protein
MLNRSLTAGALLALSILPAFAQTATVAVVSGKDQYGLYEIATGREIARVDNKDGSGDMMVNKAGVALLNNTGGNAIVLIDMKNAKEIGRIPASTLGGLRPVHSYLTPELEGRQFYVSLNDGNERAASAGEVRNDSTLTLVDVAPTSPTYLKAVGETRLGLGHHKVAFSTKRARFAVSNISDCKDVVSIYDFSNPAQINLVKSYSAADFGYDASSPVKTCDSLGKAGIGLAPHGVGTSAATGQVFHFITGTGQVAAFDIDAEQPTLKIVQTSGRGGSTIKDLPGGEFMVVPQRGPREIGGNADGALCQVGQLAIIEARTLKVVNQIPVKYGNRDCQTSLAGNLAGRAMPAYAMPSPDGRTLFVSLGTLYGRDPAEARFTAVFDISNPRNPVQQASIETGNHNANRNLTLTGDGKQILVPNSEDNTVSVIDVATRKVVRTFPTVAKPSHMVTFDGKTGPSKPVGPASAAAKINGRS